MRVRPSVTRTVIALATIGLVLPPAGWAEPKVGVVALLQGSATVVRTSAQPQPLRFKDDVFLHDRITTAEESMARILLGGKALVTVRERSSVTITEAPGVSTVHVGSGRVAVGVAKDRMQRGDVVEIRTPNVLAAIRGTVVVAEVTPGADGGRSVITVLQGIVAVARLDASGRAVDRAVPLGALHRVNAVGGGLLSSPQAITPEAARRLSGEFRSAPAGHPTPRVTPEHRAAMVETALQDIAQLAPPAGRESGSERDADSSGAASVGSPAAGTAVGGVGTAVGAPLTPPSPTVGGAVSSPTGGSLVGNMLGGLLGSRKR